MNAEKELMLQIEKDMNSLLGENNVEKNNNAATVDQNQNQNQNLSEIEFYREKLAILASRGKCKKFIGKDLSHDTIASLSAKDVIKFTHRYQAYIGSRTADHLVDGMINLGCSILGKYFDFHDIEAYKKDLKDEHKCGKYLCLASVFMLTACHVSGLKKKQTDEEDQPSDKDFQSFVDEEDNSDKDEEDNSVKDKDE